MTDPERRQHIEDPCDAALERSADDRAAFVAAACGDDGALRQEVESLLAHAQKARAAQRLALKHGELMPEGEDLHLELDTGPNDRPQGGQQRDEQRSHTGRERYQPPARSATATRGFESPVGAGLLSERRTQPTTVSEGRGW